MSTEECSDGKKIYSKDSLKYDYENFIEFFKFYIDVQNSKNNNNNNLYNNNNKSNLSFSSFEETIQNYKEFYIKNEDLKGLATMICQFETLKDKKEYAYLIEKYYYKLCVDFHKKGLEYYNKYYICDINIENIKNNNVDNENILNSNNEVNNNDINKQIKNYYPMTEFIKIHLPQNYIKTNLDDVEALSKGFIYNIKNYYADRKMLAESLANIKRYFNDNNKLYIEFLKILYYTVFDYKDLICYLFLIENKTLYPNFINDILAKLQNIFTNNNKELLEVKELCLQNLMIFFYENHKLKEYVKVLLSFIDIVEILILINDFVNSNGSLDITILKEVKVVLIEKISKIKDEQILIAYFQKISSINCEDLMYFYLEILRKKYLISNDFDSLNENKILLFSLAFDYIKNEEDYIKYFNLDFIKLSCNSLNVFLEKIEKLKFSYTKISTFDSALTLIFHNDEKEKLRYQSYLLKGQMFVNINLYILFHIQKFYHTFNRVKKLPGIKSSIKKLVNHNISSIDDLIILYKILIRIYEENILIHSNLLLSMFNSVNDYKLALNSLDKLAKIFKEQNPVDVIIKNNFQDIFLNSLEKVKKTSQNINNELFLLKFYYKNLNLDEAKRMQFSENLMLYYKDYMLKEYLDCFNFFIQIFEKHDKVNKSYNKSYKELINANSKFKDLSIKERINTYNQFFTENNINIISNLDSQLLELLQELKNHHDLVFFMKDKKESDLRNLQEFGKNISVSYMSHLFEVVNLISNLKNLGNIKNEDKGKKEEKEKNEEKEEKKEDQATDDKTNIKNEDLSTNKIPLESLFIRDLIEYFTNNSQINFKKLKNSIIEASKKLNDIDLLFVSIVDKDTELFKLKSYFLKKGEFHIKINANYKVECTINASGIDINLEKFTEIKDRYLLEEENDNFIDISLKILEIIKLIQKLLKIGLFSEKLNISFIIENSELTIKNEEFSPEDLIEKYNNYYEEFKLSLKSMYIDNTYCTFIYGNIFQYIIQNLSIIDGGLNIFREIKDNYKKQLEENNNEPQNKQIKSQKETIKQMYIELTRTIKEFTTNFYYLLPNERDEIINISNDRNDKDKSNTDKNKKNDRTQSIIESSTHFSTESKLKYPKKFKYDSSSSDIIYEILINIKNFFKEFNEENNIRLNDIMNRNLISIKSHNKYQGLYHIFISKEKIEENLIKLYIKFTGNLPRHQNIFICDSETTTEELIAFLYRAVYYPSKVLFTLVNPEILDLNKSKEIISCLDELEIDNMASCLVIIYSNEDSNIIQKVISLKSVFLKDEDIRMKEDILVNNFFKEISIVCSKNAAGVGKSKFIQEKIANEDGKYLYFPLGGEATTDRIIDRLKKLVIYPNTVIHLDLYETKKDEIIKKFLFLFLVTKSYSKREKFFLLDHSIQIIIEIPFGFIDYMKQFPILYLFTIINNISLLNIPELIVPKDPFSNIQIVANFLYYFDQGKIDDINLVLKDREKFIKKRKEITVLPDKKVREIIHKYTEFINPTYYQLNTFINILASQLKQFMRVSCLRVQNITLKKKEIKVRSIVIESLIFLALYLSKSPYDNLIKVQKLTNEVILGSYNVEKKEKEAILKLGEVSSSMLKQNLEQCNSRNIIESKLSYNQINYKNLIIINNDLESLTIMSKEDKKSEEYFKLKALYNVTLKNLSGTEELIDYTTIEGNEFIIHIKKLLSIDKTVEDIKEIVGDYVFTLDNFLKIILIVLKLRANIPVIMMGETGCGKTYLFRMLAKICNGYVRIFNVHAGIKDDDIIKFMKNEILPLVEKTNVNTVKLWVFFDEINTCNSMGLLSEIICKRTMLGESIPSNVLFVAACNPYRILQKKFVYLGLVKKDNNNNSLVNKNIVNLVYRVNPLPHIFLNYVFDFGTLSLKDEEKYILSMIRNPIKKIFNVDFKNTDDEESMYKFASKAILVCQRFIQEKNDISAVSLREGKKFIKFYQWFYNFLKNKDEKKFNIKNSTMLDDLKIIQQLRNNHQKSVILSIYMNYYLRLINQKDKEDFIQIVEKELNIKHLLKYVEEEQDFLIKNIELPKGIASNSILKQNIFALFAAINTKIPIFICGKPGCSKSLSYQIIFNSMRGKSSNNDFFKKYPRLFMQSYQGALSSTSEGILKIFHKAREQVKSNQTEDFISVVYFDELGLAELAPENPLKVLNYELEYYGKNKFDISPESNKDIEQIDKLLDGPSNEELNSLNLLNEEELLSRSVAKDDKAEEEKTIEDESLQVAFVGISNWCLDSSKLNRGIFISILDMANDDLIKTALTIADSIGDNFGSVYKDFFTVLAMSYNKYKETISKDNKYSLYIDFHCSRDFYNLIKSAAKRINQILGDNNNKDYHLSNCDFYRIGIESIEKNFGGIISLTQEFIAIFISQFTITFKDNDVNTYAQTTLKLLDNIKSSLDDSDNRYLMFVVNSMSNYIVIESIISKMNKMLNIVLGSKFEKDQADEKHSIFVLNKLQNYIKGDNVLILSDLELIYPSLYDIFNQNFSYVSQTKTCRIAVGSTNNNQVIVNENFKCIILMNEKDLIKQDPPFLNRFEKYVVTCDQLLNQRLIDLADNLYKNLQNLIIPAENKYEKEIQINLKYQFFLDDIEKIKSLIYLNSKDDINSNLTISDDEIINKVLRNIVPTFSQDLIAFMKMSKLYKENPELCSKIYDIYKEYFCPNFNLYLQKLKSRKSIIYTFSKILDKISINKSNLNNSKNIQENETLDSTNININNNLTGDEDTYLDSIKEQTDNLFLFNFLKEEEIQRYFSDFYQNNEKSVSIIHLRPCDCVHLNHLIYIIENIEKKNETDNKSFIFIIHLERILEKREPTKQENDCYYYIANHLSNYNQIFIDNLNGNSINLNNDLNYLEENLIKNILQFSNNDISDIMYNALNFIEYSFIPYDFERGNSNYSFEFVNKLLSNEEIKDLFLNKIGNSKYFDSKSISYEIFCSHYITKKDLDLFRIYGVYQKKFYEYKFSKFLIACERYNLFPIVEFDNIDDSTMSMIIEIIKESLTFLSFEDIKTSANISSNKIEKVLGLKIPMSKIAFREIKNFILSIGKELFELEQQARMYEITNEEYLKSENEYIEIVKEKILNLKNTNIFKIIEDKEIISKNKKIEDLFISDCLVFYIINNFYDKKDNQKKVIVEEVEEKDQEIFKKKIYIENIKSFLLLLIKFKFKDFSSLEFFTKISKIILWLESHNIYINILTQIYLDLLQEVPDAFSQIKSSVERNEYPLKNPDDFFNDGFYQILEALLKLVNQNLLLMINNHQNDMKPLLNKLESIEVKSSKLENVLWLSCDEFRDLQFNNMLISKYLKAYLYIEEVKKIISGLLSLSKDEKENLKIINNPESNENQVNSSYNELKNCLISQSDFLINSLSKDSYFDKIFIKFLTCKYIKVNYVQYRGIILELIFKENSYILQSLPILNKYLNTAFINNSEYRIYNIDTLKDNGFFIINNNDYKEIFNSHCKQNEILCEVLLYYFKYKFNLMLKDQYEFLFTLCFQWFKECLEYLNNADENNSKLTELYAIGYIKIYIKKITDLNFEQSKDVDINDYEKIAEFFNDNEINPKLIKLINCYILKLLINKSGGYKKLKDFDFSAHKLDWLSCISLPIVKENLLKNLFFYDYENWESCIDYFMTIKTKRGHEDSDQSYKHLARDLSDPSIINLFYDFFINEVLNDVNNDILYSKKSNNNLFEWSRNFILKIKNLSKSANSLLLFVVNGDKDNHPNLLKSVISKKESKDKEILIYCLKFVILCISKEPESWFNKIFTKDIISIIENSYIPGMLSENYLANSIKNELKKLLSKINEKTVSPGIYICECGFPYQIGGNGLPSITKICQNCDKIIGGKDNILMTDNYRIFLNENHKNYVNKYNNNICNELKPIPYKYLDDIEKKLEKSEINDKKGIVKMSKKDYMLVIKNRNFNEIHLRLCNLFIFSIIFYANKINLITSEDLMKLSPFESEDFYKVLSTNWKLLEVALKKVNIDKISIFLNMFYICLGEILNSYKSFNVSDQRQEFEYEFLKLTDKCIKNYQAFKEDYYNQKSNKTVTDYGYLKESLDLTTLSNDQFPYYKEFLLENFPSELDIQEQLSKVENSSTKYPVLSNFLKNKQNIQELECLQLINPFSNYLIDNFSFNINRNDAEEKFTINNFIKTKITDKNERKKIDQLANNFIEGYNRFQNKKVIYKSISNKDNIQLTRDKKISYCLNDIIGKQGSRLAGILETLKNMQNNYFDLILFNADDNAYVNNYKDEISKEIPIQQAKENEILTLDIKDELLDISSFYELIYLYSMKNCFDLTNNKILYYSYQNISYDFDSIEEIMSKIIFSCKRKFSDEQKFFIYAYEGYYNNNNSLLAEFLDNYPQIKLTKEEKNYIFNKGEDSQIEILFSLQKIFGRCRNENYEKDKKISEIIKKIPKFNELNKECYQIFIDDSSDDDIENNIRNNLTLEKLFYIYECIEDACFENTLLGNVRIQFKEELSQTTKKIVKEKLNKLENKKELENAVKKYIARYLFYNEGNFENSYVPYTKNLFELMKAKKDIWSEDFRLNIQEFCEKNESVFKEIQLKNIISFYDLMISDEGKISKKISKLNSSPFEISFDSKSFSKGQRMRDGIKRRNEQNDNTLKEEQHKLSKTFIKEKRQLNDDDLSDDEEEEDSF